MPSIELICVQQETPLSFSSLPFAVFAESILRSDRKPSLFQKDFDRTKGCIYHLGNAFCGAPDYEGPFFAYELLSERCARNLPPDYLELEPKIVPALFDLIGVLLHASPVGEVLFTTDWQFGPRGARRYRKTSETIFWRRHAGRKLRLNALYPIQRTDIGLLKSALPETRRDGGASRD